MPLHSFFSKLERKLKPLSELSESVIADIQAKVNIGEIFGGYFNSSENSRAFIKVGLSDIVSTLPDDLKFADFGGGDGFLTAEVKKFLENSGKKAEGIVVDANPYSLQQASKRTLITMNCALEDTKLKNFDLIIMRAVLHYNSETVQKRILKKVKTALKEEGIFIHQLSSGDIYNIRLRNELSQLPSLQRTHKSGSIHFMTIKEYLTICNGINFPTQLLGYAPDGHWTPEEMFDRFHPQVKTMTEEEKMNYKTRNLFLKQAKELILHYKATTPIEGIEIKNDTINVWRKYPIFLSRLPS